MFEPSLCEASIVRKQAISAAFGRAAVTYDRSANFQRQVGHALMDKMLPILPLTRDFVLDLGCGTGYFSQEWETQAKWVCSLDLSFSMLMYCREQRPHQGGWIQGDADALPLQNHSIDIGFSNLALQWCDDLSVPLQELRRVTKVDGVVGFSTLLQGSLFELAEAWSTVDDDNHVNECLSLDQLKISVTEAGFSEFGISVVPMVVYYPTVLAIMKDLKGIGANHLEQGRTSGLGGRQRLLALEQAYEDYRDPIRGLPVTYQVAMGVFHV